MWNDYANFLDYMEIRRRVEKKLAKPSRLFLHIAAFVAVASAAGFHALMTSGWPYMRSYFVEPGAGQWMAIWSVVLLLHGLYTYWRSGANINSRSEAIEREMRERLNKHDGSDLFHLHGLLQEDIQRRAGVVPLYMVFTLVNLFIWLPWALTYPITNFAWIVTPIIALSFAVALSFKNTQIARYEAELQQIEGKRKRRDHAASAVRLSEDGELIELDEPAPKEKRLRS